MKFCAVLLSFILGALLWNEAHAAFDCARLVEGNRTSESNFVWNEQTKSYLTVDTDIKQMPYTLMPEDQVEIYQVYPYDPYAREMVTERPGLIRMFRHPLFRQNIWNRVKDYPAYKALQPFFEMPLHGSIPTMLSPSRSVYLTYKGRLYSIKSPYVDSVDYPEKMDMRKGVKVSVLTSQLVKTIDDMIGPDPELVMLLDVLSVIDIQTGNGVVLRDLSPLQDGNATYPGFAMKEQLHKFALRTGQTDQEVMKKHFSIPFGRALAKILLRYGLVLTSVHDQNYLKRFDRLGNPLPVTMFRDLSDVNPLIEFFDDMGVTDIRREFVRHRYKPFVDKDALLIRHRENTGFLGGQAGRLETDNQIEAEFARYIFETLGRPYMAHELNATAVSRYLFSNEGHLAFANYHRRLREAHRSQH